MISFFVPGVPVPKGSLRAVAAGVVRPDNPGLKAWTQTVALFARQAMAALPRPAACRECR